MAKKPRILNIDKAKFTEWSHGTSYKADIAWLGWQMESRKLGFNVVILPPGKKAFPYHAHHGQEELFFVLEGAGTVRIGPRKHKIREGDFISLPPGRDSAHQIINTSRRPLRYLAVSTMEMPEVAEYPDSGKIGVLTGSPPGRPPGAGSLRHWAAVKDRVGYWEGEE